MNPFKVGDMVRVLINRPWDDDLKKGHTYTIKEIDDRLLCFRLGDSGTPTWVQSEHIELVDKATTENKTCDCDMISVIMVSGCQCGAI